jgi:hypothetical protein
MVTIVNLKPYNVRLLAIPNLEENGDKTTGTTIERWEQRQNDENIAKIPYPKVSFVIK